MLAVHQVLKHILPRALDLVQFTLVILGVIDCSCGSHLNSDSNEKKAELERLCYASVTLSDNLYSMKFHYGGEGG